MSTKAIIWLIVIVLVLAGGWYLWSQMSGSQAAPTVSTQMEATTTDQTQAAAPTGPSLSNGSSDASLTADLNMIDSSVNSSASASQSAQTSSDQPIQQSY